MHATQDGGLAPDLERLGRRMLPRRRLLSAAGAVAGSAALAAGGLLSPVARAAGSCTAYAAETAGPFPADGTNVAPGVTSNMLTRTGIVRRDIRSSLDTTTRAAGVRLILRLRLVDAAGCAPLAGHAVYLWHCDVNGDYSLYTLPAESYLRGLQQSDAWGRLEFLTVFPGCYAGRFPHMHLEVFESLSAASSGRNALLTSQLAMPQAICERIYANRAEYATSLAHLGQSPLATDGVFRDDSAAQLAAMTPSIRWRAKKHAWVGNATVSLVP